MKDPDVKAVAPLTSVFSKAIVYFVIEEVETLMSSWFMIYLHRWLFKLISSFHVWLVCGNLNSFLSFIICMKKMCLKSKIDSLPCQSHFVYPNSNNDWRLEVFLSSSKGTAED